MLDTIFSIFWGIVLVLSSSLFPTLLSGTRLIDARIRKKKNREFFNKIF